MLKIRINHTLRVGKRGRAIATPMVLVAFLLQIFVVQTHVHFPAATSADIGHAASGAPSHALRLAKDTGDAAMAHCPWCKAILASGSYLPLAALPIALPVAFRFLDPISQHDLAVFSASSHAWQSRAPPA
jgi:hypothetical protein